MASLPIWVRLGKRWPKQTLFMVAILGYGAGSLLWLTVRPDWPTPFMIAPSIMTGVFHIGIILMGMAMLLDTIEWDARRTGLRREGIYIGLFTFMEKVSYALGPLIIGILLSAMGYVASTEEEIVQSPSTIRAIYIGMGVIPAAVSVVTIPLIRLYDLTEDKLNSVNGLSD